MDEILERILNVERQAEEAVVAAQQEADDIAATARRDVAQVREEFRQSVAAEVAELIKTTVAEAEAEKSAALDKAELNMQERESMLRSNMDAAVRRVKDRLGYPSKSIS